MARQGLNRRDAIRMMALAAFASQFAGFENWVYAHQEQAASSPGSKKKPYRPRFFSKHEYATVFCLADLIIPTDDEPGAKEAGASEFIDFIIAHDTEMQPKFRDGLKWLDAYARQLHGKAFVELKPVSQNAILETLAYKSKHVPGEEKGREFFSLIRRYTVMGYYTSRPGMEALGVPSLKTYTESPECPHHDDPEHKHLRKVNA